MSVEKSISIIKNAQCLVAFTGAGISVESGIPPFRGGDGIWSKYNPSILELSTYLQKPETVWPVIRQLFYDFFADAKPNSAHEVLALLEKQNILRAIITQNIDNLHQDAGSKNVIEYHGNSKKFVCTVNPSHVVGVDSIDLTAAFPTCPVCGELSKPDFIFFGESIPVQAIESSLKLSESCDVMLLIGSTGEVMPAAAIPHKAKRNGATIIEINPTPSSFTYEISDIVLKGSASFFLDAIHKGLSSA